MVLPLVVGTDDQTSRDPDIPEGEEMNWNCRHEQGPGKVPGQLLALWVSDPTRERQQEGSCSSWAGC